MSVRVHELPKAKADKRQIFQWLHERSPAGAAAWLAAYDELVEELQQRAGAFGEAYENRDLERDVRQALFKTRRGRVYRVLYFIEGENVFILRLRGPGQAPLRPDEIGTPEC